jgi:hypothetical protein
MIILLIFRAYSYYHPDTRTPIQIDQSGVQIPDAHRVLKSTVQYRAERRATHEATPHSSHIPSSATGALLDILLPALPSFFKFSKTQKMTKIYFAWLGAAVPSIQGYGAA